MSTADFHYWTFPSQIWRSSLFIEKWLEDSTRKSVWILLWPPDGGISDIIDISEFDRCRAIVCLREASMESDRLLTHKTAAFSVLKNTKRRENKGKRSFAVLTTDVLNSKTVPESVDPLISREDRLVIFRSCWPKLHNRPTYAASESALPPD